MTFEPVGPQLWSLRRWGTMIVLIFGIQLGLIFWLGSTAPVRPRPTTATLNLHLAGPDSVELRALHDPTLFALPHPQGFAGPVWRNMPRPEFRSFEWAAPTNHLVLALDQLGGGFSRLVEATAFPVVQLPTQPEAAPTLPELPRLVVPAERSVLQLEGGLAQRRLLAWPELKSWIHSDILTNSVVQVVVDAEGRPVSPPTLLVGCGLAEADQYALEKARAVRFAPVSAKPTESALDLASYLSWGKMVFRWQTVPAPLVSSPAVSP